MRSIVVFALALFAAAAFAWPACVTSGTPTKLGETIFVDDPITRIAWREQAGNYAGMVFEWGGALSGNPTPAASGRVLRQVGVLLYSKNPCNSLYVMWHEGEDRVRVMRKLNPGKTTFAQCGAQGYLRLKGEIERPVHKLVDNARHWLEASVDSRGYLVVKVNRSTVWYGKVPPEVRNDGGAGFRSDNAKAKVSWLGGEAGGHSQHECRRHL